MFPFIYAELSQMVCTFEAFQPQSCVLWKSLLNIKAARITTSYVCCSYTDIYICCVTVTSVHGRQKNRSCTRNPDFKVIFHLWMVVINAGLNMYVSFSFIAWGYASFSLYASHWKTKWHKSCFLHLEILTQLFFCLSSALNYHWRDRRGKFTTLTFRNLLFLESSVFISYRHVLQFAMKDWLTPLCLSATRT
jgi:hypothetical protein